MDLIMVLGVTHQGRNRGGRSFGGHCAAAGWVTLLAACAAKASGTDSPPTGIVWIDASAIPDHLDAADARDPQSVRDALGPDARYWIRLNDAAPTPDSGVAVNAPRLLGPMSTSYVSSHRPTLSWTANDPGLDTVEVCSDRACNRVVQAATTTERRFKPEEPLPIGTYFWRVSRTTNGVRSTSHVWQFRVRSRHDLTDYSYGNYLDFNGDGLDDLIIFSNFQNGLQPFPFRGSPTGLVSAGEGLADPGQITLIKSVGDINGDGFGDLYGFHHWILCGCGTELSEIRLYLGGPAGLTRSSVTLVDSDASSGFGIGFGLGDVDGDGYGDVGVHSWPFHSNYYPPNIVFGSSGPTSLRMSALTSEGCRTCYMYPLGSSSTGRNSEVILNRGCTPGQATAAFDVISPSRATPAVTTARGVSCEFSDGGYVVSVADVNGDGRLDVAMSGNSTEAFRETMRARYFSRVREEWVETDHGPFLRAGAYANHLQDIDRDGMLDEIGSPNNGSLAVLFGSSDRWRWGPSSRVSMPILCSSPAGSGDFDGDGLIELVFICSTEGQVYIGEVARSGEIGPIEGLLPSGPVSSAFNIGR